MAEPKRDGARFVHTVPSIVSGLERLSTIRSGLGPPPAHDANSIAAAFTKLQAPLGRRRRSERTPERWYRPGEFRRIL